MAGASDPALPRGLPALLIEIAELTTVDIAIALARGFGGTRIRFPRNPRPDHPVARLVGLQAARIIGQRMSGAQLAIPSARPLLRWHDARVLRRRGLSHRAIARTLGISEDHVRRILGGIPAGESGPPAAAPLPVCPVCGRKQRSHRRHAHDPRQPDLFAGS